MPKNPFSVPTWVQDATFYQIFPDRFADGKKANDPPGTQPWESEPNGSDRMGGDLSGIRKHLDYLSDLGISAVYLNPVFASRSNHGYDTTDYLKTDPRFGTEEELKSLIKDAHQRGWHVILDGVFNHSGIDFEPFQNLIKEGERSHYCDWFFVKEFPIKVEERQQTYETFKNIHWMPKLNVDNPETRKYLIAVAQHWMESAGVDGWRLDAANEVSHDFWKAFRKAIRRTNPDAYLVGEIWPDAHDWLQGDEFDAVTNYRWRAAAYDFFAKNELSPTDFDQTLAQIRNDYPPEVMNVMLNMLSSHDSERLLSLCRKDMLRIGQCILFQMTYPGTPCLYYGDEIGIEGDSDPNNRRAMIWDEARWDKGLRDFYKRLIALRNRHAVLRRGDYQTVLTHDATRLFGYRRQFEGKSILALFNGSASPQCAALKRDAIGSRPYEDWLGTGITLEQNEGEFTVGLPARGIALLGTA